MSFRFPWRQAGPLQFRKLRRPTRPPLPVVNFLFHRLALRALRSRHSTAEPGTFQFQQSSGACPECRGFGRTIAIDLNRAIPDRSLSIAQGVVRVFRGQEMGESQKDLLRACAREEIDVNTPFEELSKADQDFVINGEKRAGEYTDEDYENDRWYGVRGFFRWLESKTYKMHVRVLLSRYRAYVKCPSCEGGRYQPEALNYKIVVAA